QTGEVKLYPSTGSRYAAPIALVSAGDCNLAYRTSWSIKFLPHIDLKIRERRFCCLIEILNTRHAGKMSVKWNDIIKRQALVLNKRAVYNWPVVSIFCANVFIYRGALDPN